MMKKLTGAVQDAVPTFAKKGLTPESSKKRIIEVPKKRNTKKKIR
jgi:hypothetical protein